MRWLVAFALFSAALLNYIDRNVLGLLAVSIQKDLHISNQQYAGIINFFLISYTIANLLSGRVVDKLGVRLSLALFVAWWTVANALTGLARSVGQFCSLRFMLGLGEAGCYTASPKAVSEWSSTAWLTNLTALAVDLVPQRILGTAFGVIACGSALGGFLMNQGVAWLIDHRSYDDFFTSWPPRIRWRCCWSGVCENAPRRTEFIL